MQPQIQLLKLIAQNPEKVPDIMKALTLEQRHNLHAQVIDQYLLNFNIHLTPRHLEILAYLDRTGPAPLNHIALNLDQPPSNTHTRLAALTHKGLVQRYTKNNRPHYRSLIKEIQEKHKENNEQKVETQ